MVFIPIVHQKFPVSLQESQLAGQDEFPGLAFGIKDMDQRQKFSSANSSQDFPSLGSAVGDEGGAKPAGVWGRGAGRLAGEFTDLVCRTDMLQLVLVSDKYVV